MNKFKSLRIQIPDTRDINYTNVMNDTSTTKENTKTNKEIKIWSYKLNMLLFPIYSIDENLGEKETNN